MSDYDYDMVVIGSGPAGQRAAIQAAKLDKRVAIIERKAVIGGGSVKTGTIPSKTLREGALYLSGYRERGVYGSSYTEKKNITVDVLFFRTDRVVTQKIDVPRHKLMRNNVEMIAAEGSFVDAHTIRLKHLDGRGQHD